MNNKKPVNYNNRFSMRDLFMNPKLEGIFPQFDKTTPLQNVYSFKTVESRVLKYLKNVMRGVITGDNELTVKGNYKTVLRQVGTLKALIEGFFNNMPMLVKNLRKNTKLYTPFASVGALEGTTSRAKKIAAMRAVVANLKYNPDFVGLNGTKKQANWIEKVGWRE